MAAVEEDLQKLMSGEVVPVQSVDFHCGFCNSTVPEDDYIPVVKRSVCYIVMALVFDDQGRVVLIQEAKESCRGKWYIPAGRVEPGENFIDGVKREVLEETGLEFEPVTVFCVETSGLTWYRIGYIGHATGGKLKTLEEKDSESLQAQWFPVDDILSGGVKPLRHKDFFRSLKIGQKYISQREADRHPVYHIGIQPYKHLICRLIVIRPTDDGALEILCCQKTGQTKLPCCRLNCREYMLSSAFSYLMKEVYQSQEAFQEICCSTRGLLTVEHCGKPERENDGICLTPVFLFPSVQHDRLTQLKNSDYLWHKLTNSSVLEEIKMRIFKEDLLIPLLDN